MKKIIAFVLCILMVVSCFMFTTSAEEEEFHDISKESLLKASSQWNYYSAPKYTIDGKLDRITCALGGYEYFRPNAPGRDPSVNIKDSWIEYRYKEYKEIESIVMYALKRSENIKYRLQVLVMGEWYEISTLPNNKADIYVYTVDGKESNGDTIKLGWDTDELVKAYNTANPDKPLPEGNITTKKFRIYFDYTDQWSPPIIYETVITGRKGVAPEFDVPDDAELSTNAALSGHMYASSSVSGHYPALGADNTATYWAAKNTTDGEWIKAEFDKAYNISKLELDFSSVLTTNDGKDKNDLNSYVAQTFDIEIKLMGIDGTWSSYATKTGISTTHKPDEAKVLIFEAATDSDVLKNIKGVQVIFTNLGTNSFGAISEIDATIADGGKCIFLAGWMTDGRKTSLATGNIAVLGTPYCSSAFDYIGISEVSYIIDGQYADYSPCWYAGTMGTGEYCGVVLDLEEGQKASISKVVLNFNDYITYDYYNMITQVRENPVKDDYVLGFEVQAKQADGSYKKIASGSSYDTVSKSYIVAFDFTDVVTDDIRVVFTSNDAGYAYLKELEVYASDIAYGDTTQNGYCSLLTDKKVAKATAESGFKIPHIIFRAPYMDIISPLASN